MVAISQLTLKHLAAPSSPPPLVMAQDTPSACIRALAQQAGLIHALLEKSVQQAFTDPKRLEQVITLSEEARKATNNLLAILPGRSR
jgi:hypothetical protein